MGTAVVLVKIKEGRWVESQRSSYIGRNGRCVGTTVVLVKIKEGRWVESQRSSYIGRNGRCVGTTVVLVKICLLYTSPSPRDRQKSRMPSSA